MKCDECGKPNAKWRCPECGCYACQSCYEGMEGRCEYCAPPFQEIKERKITAANMPMRKRSRKKRKRTASA